MTVMPREGASDIIGAAGARAVFLFFHSDFAPFGGEEVGGVPSDWSVTTF